MGRPNKKREAPAVKLPPNSGITITRDVEQLKEGDLVPDYAFTNELGKRIHLWQFRGKAVAINFLFTRCPFPTFCRSMAKNFADVQKKMLARKDGPTNWQLLTISFDPEFDQPVILRAYANSHGYNPAHWSFATGKLSDVAEFGDLFGLQFWREPDGSMNHNLRTIIVDPAGRVQKMILGNEWPTDEVVQEMVKAAGTKRREGDGARRLRRFDARTFGPEDKFVITTKRAEARAPISLSHHVRGIDVHRECHVLGQRQCSRDLRQSLAQAAHGLREQSDLVNAGPFPRAAGPPAPGL